MAYYSSLDVWNQITTTGNTLSFTYEKLDRSDGVKFLLPQSIQSCKITFDGLAEVKRTAEFTILETDSEPIDYLNDRIRPWINVLMPDGGYSTHPMGVFLLDAPTRHWENGLITRAVTGYDKTKLFQDASFGGDSDVTLGSYIIPAGSLYTDQLLELIIRSGVLDNHIKITESDLSAAVSRKITKRNAKSLRKQRQGLRSKLQYYQRHKVTVHTAIQKLIRAINYEDVWFDGYGHAVVEPKADMNDKPVKHIYRTDDKSIMLPVVDQTLDLANTPNVIIRAINQPDRPIVVSKFTNSDPSSPISTVSRGRKIVDFDTVDAASKNELDQIVRQEAINAANVYEEVTFSTMINPMHSYLDRIQMHHDGLGIDADYQEVGWSIEMKPGGVMTHTARHLFHLERALIGVPDA